MGAPRTRQGWGVTPDPMATRWYEGTLSCFGGPRSLGPPGQDGGSADSRGSSLKCCCGCQAEFHSGKPVTRAGPGRHRGSRAGACLLPCLSSPPQSPAPAPPCEPTVVQPRLTAEREGSLRSHGLPGGRPALPAPHAPTGAAGRATRAKLRLWALGGRRRGQLISQPSLVAPLRVTGETQGPRDHRAASIRQVYSFTDTLSRPGPGPPLGVPEGEGRVTHQPRADLRAGRERAAGEGTHVGTRQPPSQ